jgi:hypothetical protein
MSYPSSGLRITVRRAVSDLEQLGFLEKRTLIARLLKTDIGAPLLRLGRLLYDRRKLPIQHLTIHMERSRLLIDASAAAVNTASAGQSCTISRHTLCRRFNWASARRLIGHERQSETGQPRGSVEHFASHPFFEVSGKCMGDHRQVAPCQARQHQTPLWKSPVFDFARDQFSSIDHRADCHLE